MIPEFNPNIFSFSTNPFYIARIHLVKAILKNKNDIHGKLLDVGCGQKPYRNLFNSVNEYIGLEFDSESNRKGKCADYFYDGNIFPFESNYFDVVFSSQVLEHVFNPNQFMSEINRVLKKDGILFITVPFMWNEHEVPFDFGRYTSFGIKSLITNTGFEVVHQEKICTGILSIAQLIIAHLFETLSNNKGLIKKLLFRVLFPIVTLLGFVLNTILPKNGDIFLDNLILARKNQ